MFMFCVGSFLILSCSNEHMNTLMSYAHHLNLNPLSSFSSHSNFLNFYCILLGVSDPSLVYDKFANVEKLVEKARKLKSKEKDMVKLQLLDMSDSLPPLSKFTHGYKFDPWQRRGNLFHTVFVHS